MLNGNIARFSLSMTWRFLLITALMTVLILPLVPVGGSPEEALETTPLLFLLPLLQVFTVYASLYLTLIWLRYSNMKGININDEIKANNQQDANFPE